MNYLKKYMIIILGLALAVSLAACAGKADNVNNNTGPESTQADSIPEEITADATAAADHVTEKAAVDISVQSDIVGMIDSHGHSSTKAMLLATPGQSIFFYDENGARVADERYEQEAGPGDQVEYTGSAVISVGTDVDESKLDTSGAVVTMTDGSGYFADEYILSNTSLESDGRTYVLSEGDIEWNTWDYDVNKDPNSTREWSIMGGDGNGVYRLNFEISGITYDGKETEPVSFPVIIYAYGRSCIDIANGAQLVENTYDPEYTSGVPQSSDTLWFWYTENNDSVSDGRPFLNDLYTDYFSVVWPEGTDASGISADDVTVTLSNEFGEEYILSEETAYGEHELAVASHKEETEIFVMYQQWAMTPVYSTMTIRVSNGDIEAENVYDIATVAAWSVQTGGGGEVVDHQLTVNNYYGLADMTPETSLNPTYCLYYKADDGAVMYYCEDENGKGYVKAGKIGAPDEAWIGDATEYFNLDVINNAVFAETRLDTTEEKEVDGEMITFEMSFASFLASTSDMVSRGARLLPGYNLKGTNITKWAWTDRYQSGWLMNSPKPEGCPYMEGAWWYGYLPGSDNPAYTEYYAGK